MWNQSIKRGLNHDTGNFIVHLKLEDIYADLAVGVKKKFYTSNLKSKDHCPYIKTNNIWADAGWIRWNNNQRIRNPKIYSYLTDDGCSDKKVKATKKFVSKQEIKSDDYKKCFEKVLKKVQEINS